MSQALAPLIGKKDKGPSFTGFFQSILDPIAGAVEFVGEKVITPLVAEPLSLLTRGIAETAKDIFVDPVQEAIAGEILPQAELLAEVSAGVTPLEEALGLPEPSTQPKVQFAPRSGGITFQTPEEIEEILAERGEGPQGDPTVGGTIEPFNLPFQQKKKLKKGRRSTLLTGGRGVTGKARTQRALLGGF